MRRHFVVFAILVATLVPGAVGQGGAPQVTDSDADARENDTSSVSQFGRTTVCRAGGGATGIPCGAAPPGAPTAGGEPAPATMEAISATLWDTPESLFVRMELASVDEKFPGAVRADGTAGTLYHVCWTTGPTPCSERVILAAMPSAGGVAVTSVFRVDDASCNDFGRCAWRVEATLEQGSPGAITWEVPRDILPNGTAGTVLQGPQMQVTRYYSPSGRIVWPMEDGVGYTLRGPAPGVANSGYAANHYFPVDTTTPGVDHRLATLAAPRREWTFERLDDAPGDVVGGARTDLDILGLTIREEDAKLTISLEVATVDTRPLDHELLAGFDLENGRFVSWGYTVRGGRLAPYGQICAVPGCFTSTAPAIDDVPVNITLQPGTPGWIHATFSRDSLTSPPRGSLLGAVEVTLFTYDEQGTRDAATPAGRAQTFATGMTDTLAYAPPWTFRMDSRSEMTSAGIRVEDPPGDVSATPELESEKGRFDITYVSAEGLTPTLSVMTVSIADLSSIDVPPGTRGFLYAISLEMESGQSFMAGFLRTGRNGVDASQEFFCSEDVVAFVPEPRDPDETIRRAITGLVSHAPGGGGGARRGSLILEVPHDCLGATGPGPLSIKRMSAGSYLLPLASAGGALAPRPLDTVDHAEPFTLSAAEIVEPGPPWYANPFGIESFWDILGIGSALAASGLGVIAVRHKRRLVARYLQRIEDLCALHANDAIGQAQALAKLREELKEGLLHGRVEHAHFTIIDQRIDERLSAARVRSLASQFDELSHRMLTRLQDMLHDGHMSGEDYRVFCMMLEETSLTADAKERVRTRLRRWVLEDREHADAPPPG